MTCDELNHRLTDYAEGALTADVCREVELHLAGCRDCGQVRHDLEALSRLCRELEAIRLPDGVRRRIEGLLEPRPTA